ncbi:hypothetical protein P152DRAFT_485304 [Eremomyces bilateralis CBS 781.70]|uniref:Molybdate-anion transporter n=1 Tax=Eremomyces bilateralis CBS 781.70 TaxID=1392243 RepID=A0A6G1FS62_9PEZI|nr:uncharacterized protein P152DRAFT_485304 [Eremomyces bilateralis CBS 781.70]KAF1808617.1 hypothetical protein P152DRAFT_485304 [Eremomyces bilateralis CBS 781.70]
MTGFFSGVFSSFFIGSLADRYGRKAACLGFCIAYSISCLTVLFNDIIILFLGRALAGIGAKLLYSIFFKSGWSMSITVGGSRTKNCG